MKQKIICLTKEERKAFEEHGLGTPYKWRHPFSGNWRLCNHYDCNEIK